MMKKQLAVVMSAAVLAAGGWGWAGSSAHAAANTYAVTVPVHGEEASQQSVTYADVFVSNWLASLPDRVSGLYSPEQDVYEGLLAGGASIAAAAGVASSTIISDLTAIFTKDAQNEVAYGYLTEQEAADAAKQLDSLLPKLIDQAWTGYDAAAAALNPGREALNNRLSQLVQLTSGISGVSTADLRAALQSGQSLLDASGLEEADLTAYLLSGLNQELDRLVNANRLTQAEASGLASEAALDVAKLVNTKGYDAAENKWMDTYAQSIIQTRLNSIVRLAVIYADADYADVTGALAAGQSLQAATGMDAGVLVGYLQADVDKALDAAWMSGALSSPKLQEWKAEAQKQLLAAVTANSYATAAEAAPDIVKESLRSVVGQAASNMGVEAAALRSQLDGGTTLAAAADVSVDELASTLYSSVAAYIDQAVNNGWLKQEAAASTKEAAYAELLAVVDQAGYAGEVDTDAYLQERTDRIVNDAAVVTGVPAAQILEGLAQGRSLAAAAQTDAATLFKGLMKQTNKEVNLLAATGSLSSQDADSVKADYSAMLLEALNPAAQK
ncbi:hypothetical protein [Paenibacillus mesotrionivorans]|uniref:Uncharacterized protein n=1 Tax=Paenibacillus mesotrionivorans TaxID=3160968 RepID=A0ACC7P374_9BACL